MSVFDLIMISIIGPAGALGAAVLGTWACTIDEPISGFRGLRKRWWDRSIERPFPDWRTP